MKTQDLIEMLSLQDEQLQLPQPNFARLFVLSLLASVAWCVYRLGVDAAWTSWLMTTKYWAKLGFGLVTMVMAWGLLRAGIVPGKRTPYASVWVGLPTALALSAFVVTPSSVWAAELFRPMWSSCAPSILTLALPIWVALVIFVRAQAPTNLRRAGALMGGVAGGAAAAVYTLNCPEFSPLYVGVWYGSAIALCALLSAVVAPRLLRW